MSISILALLTAGAALAEPLPDPATCTEPLDAYMSAVATGGKRDAYLCLAALDPAQEALISRLSDEALVDSSRSRISRALAIHLLQRLDTAISVEAVRVLEPAERNLVRDGIHANRGRRTASEEHHTVFEQFDWYSPVDNYSNRLLQDVDMANIAMLDDPPPEPVEEAPPTAADAIAETQDPNGAPEVETWCGCQAPLGAAGGLWLAGLGLVGWRRR